VVLAPTNDFIAKLPNGKIPDRKDFKTYMDDFAGREDAWRTCVCQSQQLAQEFKQFLVTHHTTQIHDL
jgi:hypothetical protein